MAATLAMNRAPLEQRTAPQPGTQTQAAAPGTPPVRLPPLRSDLELSPGPVTVLGQPTWTLHDPAANRFFRLGAREVDILAAWGAGAPADIAQAAAQAGGREVDEADVQQLASFLNRNHLLRAPGPEAVKRLLSESGMRSGPKHWMRSYLSFRIHLLQPDAFLERLSTRLSFVFSPWFALFAAGLCLTSLVLVLRQWELFWATVPEFINARGAALMLVAVFSAKVVHELGHGLAAKRFGLKVTSMGVAFLILWPVLFTNVTQAWKLNDRRQRIVIGASGLAAELFLAGLAGLGWLVLDPGPVRDICFVLSATSWVMSLVVNINPFMRFDGYYLLADLLGVDNLRERGQALLNWRIREWLAGYGDAPPERLPRTLGAIVLAHAVSTRIYLFTLTLSIAAVVYALAFKTLGIILALGTLYRSLVIPLAMEARKYWQRRDELAPVRFSLRTLGLIAGAAFLLFWPWSGSVNVQALLTAQAQAALFAPFDGRIVQAPEGEAVTTQAGQPLFVLDSQTLQRQLSVARIQQQAALREVSVLGMDREKLKQRLGKESEAKELAAAIRGIEAQLAECEVSSPISGRVELPLEPYEPGDHVAKDELLARVVDNQGARLVAYVDELDLGRIRVGAEARFYPKRPELGSVDCEVVAIDATAAESLENRGFASVYGGSVPTRSIQGGGVVLRQSVYRVVLAPTEPVPDFDHEAFGKVSVASERTSLASRIYKKIKGFLIRELGI